MIRFTPPTNKPCKTASRFTAQVCASGGAAIGEVSVVVMAWRLEVVAGVDRCAGWHPASIKVIIPGIPAPRVATEREDRKR